MTSEDPPRREPSDSPSGGSGAVSGGSGGPSEDAAGSGTRGRGPQDSAVLHIAFNGALLAIFAFLFHAAGALPDSRWEPLGSGTFPRIVLACLMVLNAFIIVSQFGAARAEVRAYGRDFGRIAASSIRSSYLVTATYMLFGVFALSLSYLGFVLSAFCFILIVQLFLGPWTARSLVLALTISAVTAFGVNYVFDAHFNVFLPGGSIWR